MPKSKHRKFNQSGSRRRLKLTESRIAPEDRKMSQVLLDFIAPYKEHVQDDAAMERLIAIGVMAWNTALLPEQEREKVIDETARKILSPGRLNPKYWLRKIAGKNLAEALRTQEEIDFIGAVNELIEWKIQKYDKNKRFIVSFQVDFSSKDLHLSVISTLPGINL
jgi:hypothetical protein